MRHWFITVMVLLVALQSVVASADLHAVHQAPVPHQIIEATLDPASPGAGQFVSVDSSPPAKGQAPFDCQHCCHCQGQLVLLDAAAPTLVMVPSRNQVEYRATLATRIPTSLLRPPIV